MKPPQRHEYIYRGYLRGKNGQRCRVTARGHKTDSALIEFEDKTQLVVPRTTLRQVRLSLETERATRASQAESEAAENCQSNNAARASAPLCYDLGFRATLPRQFSAAKTHTEEKQP